MNGPVRADQVDDPDGPLEEVLLDSLAAVLPERFAAEALERAYGAERLETLPSEPAALRFFLTGGLRRVLVEEMGAVQYDAVMNSLTEHLVEVAIRQRASRAAARRRSDSGTVRTLRPPAAHRQLLVVSLDLDLCAALSERLDQAIAVSRVESFFDFAPLLEMDSSVSAAVVVDVPTSPISIPVMARMAYLIPPAVPVIVAGLSDADWQRVVGLFPDCAAWRSVATLEATDATSLFDEAAHG